MEMNMKAWHDLRKKPDDLPKTDGVPYMVAYSCSSYGGVPYGFERNWSDIGWNAGYTVIAWREIDEFEGVKR